MDSIDVETKGREMPHQDLLWPPTPLLTELLGHCRAEHPDEACGLWGRSAEGPWRLHPMANHSPAAVRRSRFALDPVALLPLLEAQDAGAMTIHGLYHSHPNGPALLSATDQAGLRFAGRPAFPGWDILVVGLPHDGPATLAMYRWTQSVDCWRLTLCETRSL